MFPSASAWSFFGKRSFSRAPTPLVPSAATQVVSAFSSFSFFVTSAFCPPSACTSTLHAKPHFSEHPPIVSGTAGSSTRALIAAGPASAGSAKAAIRLSRRIFIVRGSWLTGAALSIGGRALPPAKNRVGTPGDGVLSSPPLCCTSRK